jgi:hypothetical protein
VAQFKHQYCKKNHKKEFKEEWHDTKVKTNTLKSKLFGIM